MQVLTKRGIYYGWVIVGVSFLTLTLAMGVRFTFGVFYINILAETGWSRASTAGIFSLSMLVYAPAALGVGAAFDWLGPRRMFPLATLLLGIGFFLCSRITALWQFYLYYGVFVGIAFTAIGFIPHVSLISRWFVRRRGLATSLALAGQGAGALLFAPLSEYLIGQYGWQTSFLVYAIGIPGLLLPLMLLLYRDNPASLGLYPDGDQAPRVQPHVAPLRPPAMVDRSYLRVIKTRVFWALFLVVFTNAFNLMTFIVHQNQYLVDISFEPGFAAWMLGLNGILRAGGSVIWGSLSDRITRETSFTICVLFGVIAMPCLISAQTSPDTWRVVLFVLLIGVGYGGVGVLYGTSVADLFQGPNIGKILGILDVGFGLGAALGTYLAGFLYDRLHTYQISFYMVMGMMLAAIVGMWVAAPRSVRQPSAEHASSPAKS